MQIVQIKKDQKEIWNKFVAENCSESFLQAWEWGSFNRALGKKIWRIGIVEDSLPFENKMNKFQIPNSKLLAVALIVKYDLPFGRSYLYCPRGPVTKISNIQYPISNILDLLFSEIKKIAKGEKAIFLRFDPSIEMDDCEIVKGSTALRRLWSQHTNLKKSSNEIQPKNTLILDLTKSEEELLKEMKQKTRYNIRLAGRKSVDIGYWILDIENQKYFKEKFEEFWKLVEETSRRDKFSSHSKNYYWKMLESDIGQCRFQTEGDIRECRLQAEGDIPECLLRAKLYLAEYQDKIIAANIVLYFGDYCVYLHGASSNENRNMMAPYLLQWRQIIDAKKAGCKKYDFWGVSAMKATASTPKATFANVAFGVDSWSGITKFKKGFGGYEKNYIGAHDLVFNNIGYAIYGIIRKVRSFL